MCNYQPFKGQDHRDVNAAAEDHVVKLIQEISEQVLLKLCTDNVLSEALQDTADDENIVEHSQASQQAVKDAAHLLAEQNRDSHGIGNETQAAQGDLSHSFKPPGHRKVELHLRTRGTIAL